MEKTVKTTGNEAVSTATVPVKATVSTGSYFSVKDGEVKEYVKCVLSNPFSDPDFGDVEIAPKWRDAKGVFDFKAKKILRTHDIFDIEGEIKINSYVNKQKKKKVTYPALLFVNPFGEHKIEFSVRGDENAAVFSDLASAVFKTQLDAESVATAKDAE